MATQFSHVMVGQKQNSLGKWYPVIDTMMQRDGDEEQHKMVSFSGGFGFDTQDEAHQAGERAVAVITKTGAFPNMCEKY